jgi:hypothetical protein
VKFFVAKKPASLDPIAVLDSDSRFVTICLIAVWAGTIYVNITAPFFTCFTDAENAI